MAFRLPSLTVPWFSMNRPLMVFVPSAPRPLTAERGGAIVSVPSPALMSEGLPLPTPLPPARADEMVRSPRVQTLRPAVEAATWLMTPPLMVETLPGRTRMPPERRLNWTPSASARPAPPSMVSELRCVLAATAVLAALAAVSSRLEFVTTPWATPPKTVGSISYSAASSQRMLLFTEPRVANETFVPNAPE